MAASGKATVKVRAEDGSTETAQIDWRTDDSGYPLDYAHVRIRLSGESREGVAPDCFDAFQLAREYFESAGYRFLCYGASPGVWPSGLRRQMQLGLVGYKHDLNREPGPDLFDIFESGSDIVPSTVEEQNAFAQAWIESIAERPKLARRSSIKDWWKRIRGNILH